MAGESPSDAKSVNCLTFQAACESIAAANQYARGRASEEAVRAVAVATAAESIHQLAVSTPRELGTCWRRTAARIATEMSALPLSHGHADIVGDHGGGLLTRQPSGNGAYIGVCGAQVKQIPSGGLPSVCLAEY